jgi:hypothetical protein
MVETPFSRMSIQSMNHLLHFGGQKQVVGIQKTDYVPASAGKTRVERGRLTAITLEYRNDPAGKAVDGLA